MKENINALDEINKGATMGMDAIHFIIDKIDSSDFKDIVNKQYKDYERISEVINEIYDILTQEEFIIRDIVLDKEKINIIKMNKSRKNNII
jgi:hypothetical protein